MKVRDFMTKDPVTIDSKTPIMAALQSMKDNGVKRLPVMENEKFVGLITRSLINKASPSKASRLSVYELNYLISKMTVGDIMLKDPITISPDYPVEEAIWLGKKHKIGGFPVVENNKLLGILSTTDISQMVSDALGLEKPDSKRFVIDASGKKFGYLKNLVEVMDSNKISILSIMTIPKTDKGDWYLVLRIEAKDAEVAASDLRKRGFKIVTD